MKVLKNNGEADILKAKNMEFLWASSECKLKLKPYAYEKTIKYQVNSSHLSKLFFWVKQLSLTGIFCQVLGIFVHCVRSLWERFWNEWVPAQTFSDLPSCTSKVMKHEFKRSDFTQVSMEARRENSHLKLYFSEPFTYKWFQRK